MIRIWEEWVENKTQDNLNTSIKSAYSIVNKIKISWVQDSLGLTIQEWIDKCCDELEEEGYDLQITSVDLVKEKFVQYDISIDPPKEYKQLQNALVQANKTLEMLSNFEADEATLDQIKSTIRLLTSEMKELS